MQVILLAVGAAVVTLLLIVVAVIAVLKMRAAPSVSGKGNDQGFDNSAFDNPKTKF